MRLEKVKFTKIDRKEVLRYAQAKDEENVSELLDECIKELGDNLDNQVVYDDFYANIDEDDLNFGFTKIKSKDLAKSFSNCKVGVVFAATIGMGIERLIEKYNKISPAKALMFNALGTERIENLCDNFAKYIANEYAKIGLMTKPRYSPGYGDVSLDVQKDIMNFLDCRKMVGITLNESLLMSPSKSVTAFIPLQDLFQMFDVVEEGGPSEDECTSNCATCKSHDCAYKK